MEVQFELKDNGKGSFFVQEEGQRMAEMVIAVTSGNLTVYHTEVNDKYQGKGVSALLLKAMVDYARANNLKVVPLCAYVNAQFRRHPEQYADIWNKNWHSR